MGFDPLSTLKIACNIPGIYTEQLTYYLISFHSTKCLDVRWIAECEVACTGQPLPKRHFMLAHRGRADVLHIKKSPDAGLLQHSYRKTIRASIMK